KRAPRSRQRHDLYAKYHDYDSEISDLLGECGLEVIEQGMRRLLKKFEPVFDAVAQSLPRFVKFVEDGDE
ncbi:hypothetical protein ACFOMH_19820, partial [Paracoccus mangrovi]